MNLQPKKYHGDCNKDDFPCFFIRVYDYHD